MAGDKIQRRSRIALFALLSAIQRKELSQHKGRTMSLLFSHVGHVYIQVIAIPMIGMMYPASNITFDLEQHFTFETIDDFSSFISARWMVTWCHDI